MKTLFICAPGVAGVLVETTSRRRRKVAMQFADTHAALDWCEKTGVSMIYIPTGASAEDVLAFAG